MNKKILVIGIPAVLVLSAALVVGLRVMKRIKSGNVEQEQTMQAVSVKDLQPGNYYVKHDDEYYVMPVEDTTFASDQLPQQKNGIVGGEHGENRIAGFITLDTMIPTLYSDEQLVYVSEGEDLKTFTWERYKDLGYSIGVSGLAVQNNKLKTGADTQAAAGSSYEAAAKKAKFDSDQTATINDINGKALSSADVTDGGTIKGMSKGAEANVNVYFGTNHISLDMTADTHFFKAFETYTTNDYTLSPDGYAVITVPQFLKDGYYMINNKGFVKYLSSVKRGEDESGVVLDTPYYYTDRSGKVLTYYEWIEANGGQLPETETKESGSDDKDKNAYNPDDFDEKENIQIDVTQQHLAVKLRYKYTESQLETEAEQTGSLPKAVLMDPVGRIISFEADTTAGTDGVDQEGYTNMIAETDTVPAGDWYVLFRNFDNIHKTTSVSIGSGNATTYIHSGKDGSINIYYEASDKPHDFNITWEKTDRKLDSIEIEAPDGTKYTSTDNPQNIVMDQAGKFTMRMPSMSDGTYKIKITGDQLGRVWVDCVEAPEAETQPETDAQAEAPAESAADAGGEETQAQESAAQ